MKRDVVGIIADVVIALGIIGCIAMVVIIRSLP